MPIRECRRSGAAALAVAGVLSGSCAGWRVPNSERALQEEAITGGKGARAHLRLASGAEVRGELISAEGVYIWLLRDDGRLVNFPVESVRDASLGVFRTREAELTAWTIVGALSTFSHGVYIIFSLPAWLLVGIPSTYVESRRGFIEYPQYSWQVLGRYARFPQGLTEDMKERLLSGATPEAPAPAVPKVVTPTVATPAVVTPGAPDDSGAPSVEVSPTGGSRTAPQEK
jgi:hypothetical protein